MPTTNTCFIHSSTEQDSHTEAHADSHAHPIHDSFRNTDPEHRPELKNLHGKVATVGKTLSVCHEAFS